MLTQIFTFSLLSVSLLVFWLALRQARHGHFYTDTHWLAPLGIFVWGDALILAPFWTLCSLAFFFFEPINVLRVFLFFYAVRAFFEVIYWLNHQAVKSDYMPPLFRAQKWLKPSDAAILFQLLQMCIFMASAALLWASFQAF